MSSAASAQPRHTNRLIHETSPYLLQHAHNPVEWYPWGPEAFEAARKQNKPIFLSVGYSACYWCHVMERQSFENETIARELNHRFISIKVDREERPDVDQLYMLAVQMLTQHGGWPMSVFLTPDLRPFYGGTYFPPTDVYGRPGFLTVLRAVEEHYRARPADVEKTTAQLLDLLAQLSRPQPVEAPITINQEFIRELIARSVADYDRQFGGFGAAPKFPRQTLLELLLIFLRESAGNATPAVATLHSQLLSQLRQTLNAMADGGIHDHLAGGFHRYSTDAQWLVPHFEIMLYDNAILAWVYTEAHRQTHEERYARVARGILDFLLEEMTSPAGAFHTAFDAEVDTLEGDSYLWTAAEIDNILAPADAALFKTVYGLDRGPNFADPHYGTGQPDKNILYLPEPLATVAESMGITVEHLDNRLAPMRRKLLETRRRRKQPLLDTKILTSWNALAIRAFAFAGRVFHEPRYTRAAAAAADFLLQHHRLPDGALCRSSRNGVQRHDAFLDDYAFLVQALLELHASPGQVYRREQAQNLMEQMIDRFADRDEGGFYFTAKNHKDLIVRQKIGADSPLPSGNAVAAMVLLELEHEGLARDTLAAFASQLDSSAESMSAMVEACLLYLKDEDPISISPGPWRGEAAQPTRPPTPDQIAAAALSIATNWADPATLLVRLNINPPFHINAHNAGKDLLPTTLAIDGPAADDVDAIDYPEGEEHPFPFTPQPVRVYTSQTTITVRFKTAMASRGPMQLSLSYQPCDDQACFPATTKRAAFAAP